jgi:hypothetical protein
MIIPSNLPIIYFIYLLATFISLMSVYNNLSKKIKSIILAMFIPLLVLSIILIISPNTKALILIMALTSICILTIALWKPLYTDKDIRTGVRKIFIVYGLILPFILGLFYLYKNSLENRSLSKSFVKAKKNYNQPINSTEKLDDLERDIDELNKEYKLRKKLNQSTNSTENYDDLVPYFDDLEKRG